MPKNSKAKYVNDYSVFDFPDGTVLITTHYFENVLPENNISVSGCRYIENTFKKSPLSKRGISCQYLNLLKILYIKRISHCFRYCQRLRYIEAVIGNLGSFAISWRYLQRGISTVVISYQLQEHG